MDGEKEAEISWSEKFMISSEMSSAWSSVVSQGPEVPWPDWLSAIVRLRRLIGCDTFHSLTHFSLHSHSCRPIKLYMTAKDSWNVLNLLQHQVQACELRLFC